MQERADRRGYAKEMSKEYQAKQATHTAEHLKKQDIVITTALIPGRPAPKLVSAEMVKSMKPGSVLVDLAVERGGNVEGARPGEVVEADGVKIVGYTNVAGRVAASASGLYACNLFSFIETLIERRTGVAGRRSGGRAGRGHQIRPAGFGIHRGRRHGERRCAERRRHHHQGEAARGQRVGAVQARRAGRRHHGPIWQ